MKLSTVISAMLAIGLLSSSLPLLAVESAPVTPRGRRHEWRENHPARARDNARIRNQKHLLHQDLKSGKITQDQYNAQVKDLNTIKKEEVLDARANENGGHLTPGQQQTIKQQLNESRKDINQMDGGKTPPAPAPPAQ